MGSRYSGRRRVAHAHDAVLVRCCEYRPRVSDQQSRCRTRVGHVSCSMALEVVVNTFPPPPKKKYQFILKIVFSSYSVQI